nr:alpha-amylase family glycosyl hydrolase [Pedosphaera parvula]
MGHPLLHEINTRCWLRSLAEEQGRPVTLESVPDSEFDRWKQLGFTHIWLMGIWTTGPKSRSHALHNPSLRQRYTELLPGWQEEDVPGSPYAIADYEVPADLGGEAGLKKFRLRLNGHGLKLVLDFVPNHVGLDHPWVESWPELLVHSSARRDGTFQERTLRGTLWIAHGKDPYFGPWTDTVQLDYRNPATRTAMIQVLRSIARRCDGVRCDMAMLLLNGVFQKTWTHFPANHASAEGEFWSEAISAVKADNSEFLFIAEAYWGLEGKLQSLGFDYTYDKDSYDLLVERRYSEFQRHLLDNPPEYLARSVHFLENHDEKRISSILSLEEERAAALVMIGLPGMRLLYEGQMQGVKIQTPVQLGRWPREKAVPQIEEMYFNLLTSLRKSAVGKGEGKVLQPQAAWDGNPTMQNFVVVQWKKVDWKIDVVVVNLASHRGQCRIWLEEPDLKRHDWEMRDLLGNECHMRSGAEMVSQGLYLDLPEYGAQVFRFTVKA